LGLLVIGSVLAALLIAPACSQTSDSGGVGDAAVYVAVIRRVAVDASADLPAVVFVESLPGAKLSLADQAAIVKAFDGATEVRFIDDRVEAIDGAEPGEPVRRKGVLVRVGKVEASNVGAQVKAVRYVDRNDEQTMCVQLRQSDQGWEAVSADRC
jgi:hypothetical protein